jgi:hypothetical protein
MPNCGCSESVCLVSDIFRCKYILDGTFTTCDGKQFTATFSATGMGPNCYVANVVADRNLHNTLCRFLKCHRPTIVDKTYTVTKKCYKIYI